MKRITCIAVSLLFVFAGYSQLVGTWDGAGFETLGSGYRKEYIPAMSRMHITEVKGNMVKGEIFLLKVGYKYNDVQEREKSIYSQGDVFAFETTLSNNQFTVTHKQVKAIEYNMPPIAYESKRLWDGDKDTGYTALRFVLDPKTRLIELTIEGAKLLPAKLYFQPTVIDTVFVMGFYKKIYESQTKEFPPGKEEEAKAYHGKMRDERQLSLRDKLLLDRPGAVSLRYIRKDSVLLVQLKNIQPFPLRVTPREYDNLKSGKMYLGDVYFTTNFNTYTTKPLYGIWFEFGRVQLTDYSSEIQYPNNYYFETGMLQMISAQSKLLSDSRFDSYRVQYQKAEIK